MLDYTKKEINLLAGILTMFIFMIYIIFFINDIFLKENYHQVYQEINIVNTEKTKARRLKAQIQEAKEESKKEAIKLASTYEQVRIENKEEEITETQEESLKTEINIYKTNPWRIKIPSLGLDAPIAEGTSQEALRRTVGHFEQSSMWNGNVALAGHNRGYRCNFFQEIKNLKKGDTIIYSTDKGEKKYKVTVNCVIKETNWRYIEPTKDNRITLITCEENRREYRRCIQAVEVKT